MPVIRIDADELADFASLLDGALDGPAARPAPAPAAPRANVAESDDAFEALLSRTLSEAAPPPAPVAPPKAPTIDTQDDMAMLQALLGPGAAVDPSLRPPTPAQRPGAAADALARRARMAGAGRQSGPSRQNQAGPGSDSGGSGPSAGPAPLPFPGSGPSGPTPTDAEAQESRVVGELRDKVKTLTEETQRFRQRISAEAQGARSQGRQDVFRDILPVVDALESALSSAREGKDLERLCDGLELCLKRFFDTAKTHGLTTVDPKGDAFDPQHHEALQQMKTGQSAPGTVVKTLRRGYLFDDRLFRPAQVVVES